MQQSPSVGAQGQDQNSLLKEKAKMYALNIFTHFVF